MAPRRTLLVNPPLVNGVAFTRQGRCQEREIELGTTKPPYTLLVIASLLRQAGVPFRLVDLTADGRSATSLAAELERDAFRPDLVIFPSTTPTLEADAAAMAALKARFGATLVCFGPHASTVPVASMEQAPDVDVMLAGEPEDAALALATGGDLDGVAGVVLRAAGGSVIPPPSRGVFKGFETMPFPAWDLLPLDNYRLPMVREPYVIVETSRGCPYACDFCVAPVHQGHAFRQRDPGVLVDEIARARQDLGVRFFYLWGDTVTLDPKTFGVFSDELIARDLDIQWFGNARADSLTDPAFVHRLRQSGCWMLSMGIESSSPDIRRDMLKRLEERKIRAAFANLREAGIKSFAFFVLGYPGDTPRSMKATAEYAIDLAPDFANFYPAVPYPGTALYEKVRRAGMLPDEDWSKMEYSYYLIDGQGLNEQVVMAAITSARRRFFLRPGYLRRHLADVARLAWSKPGIALRLASRVVLGEGVLGAAPPGMALPRPTSVSDGAPRV